jgi:cold shock CspA family protein
MKVHYLAILLVVGAALFVPSVSAKIIDEKDGYIVTSGDTTVHMPDISRLASSSLSQGQAIWYSTSVPSKKTAFSMDLYWGTPTNSLSLTIYTPDSSVLGPYYDAADGRTDGRISLRISKSGGLSSGTWSSKVYGDRISGSQSYSYSASAG